MSDRVATRVGLAIAATSVGLLIAGIVLAALNGFANAYGWGSAAVTFALCGPGLAATVVGALIVTRHPRHGVAWLCLAVGFGVGINIAASHYAFLALKTDPGSLPGGEIVAWFATWSWIAWLTPLVAHLTLVFPDGRPLSSRWRMVGWAVAAFGAIGIAGYALRPGPLEAPFAAVDNPLAIGHDRGLLDSINSLGLSMLALGVLAAAASMVVRFRRSDQAQRAQIKWFAVSTGAVALLIGVGAFTFFGGRGGAAAVGADLVTLAYAAPLVATGIAILRYRLYDIDVVINRALVYGALTATLAATYVVTVLVLQLALSAVTEDSGVAVAISTLAVAGAFRPARARIQGAVDRRFYRRKYDAQRTLEQFGTRLRDELDLDALNAELRGVVANTMQPAHVSLWLRTPEGGL